MNHGEAGSAGSRRGSRGRSPASGHFSYRQKSESPVTGDRALNESFAYRGRGFRGRGSCTPSWSPRNNSGYAYGPVQAWVKKPSQVPNVGAVEKGIQQDRKAQEDGVCSSKQPGEGDCQDILRSSASSSSKYINLSGGSFISRGSEDKDGARMPCDLVNKMKEALLSPSYQKVELSSVEDRDIAQKSGGAGNSSNESNKEPFDIVREEKVMGLKPSLLVLNREKKKGIKGFTGTVIRPGMVLLKNYLSINDQVMIVNKCRKLGLGEGGFYQPGYLAGAVLHLKMMCLGKNWEPETSQYRENRLVDNAIPPKIPVEFSQFVEKAIKESQSLVATTSSKGEDEIPSISPDICIVNFYTSTGRLGLHQDKDESDKSIRKGLPVVSFSIGDTAEFLYGDERDEEKAEKIELESGDVLIFGGKSRKIFHGVRSILEKTVPSVLAQETNLRPGRLNLTFRQY